MFHHFWVPAHKVIVTVEIPLRHLVLSWPITLTRKDYNVEVVSKFWSINCLESSYVTGHVAWTPRDHNVAKDDLRGVHVFEFKALLIR